MLGCISMHSDQTENLSVYNERRISFTLDVCHPSVCAKYSEWSRRHIQAMAGRLDKDFDGTFT
jgi:hypothetical protein